jgi:uncharacterized protein (TIGR02444 family)
MSVWDWVLAAYARPGVPETCLELQDRYGQNTSLLLWAVKAETADPALLERAAEVTKAWDDTTLKPLRAVRRSLKPPFPPVADHAREKLREEVKAAELRAERTLIETLATMGKHAKGGTPALEALRAAVRATGSSAPDEMLARLALALQGASVSDAGQD